uniref:Putative transcription factor bHLH056 n=2 Tax=Anthurium amnicola TaxID=1678845 RepID=A0A1D1Z8U1_9ARAE
MSLPPKDAHGVKLFAWNANDTAAGVPIKKRRFLFKRSPSPPPSHSATPTADSCEIQLKETTSLEPESCVSGASGQMPDTGCADFRDASLQCRGEICTDKEMNLVQNFVSSPSCSEGPLFTLNNVTPGFGNGGKLISENRSAFRPISGSIPEAVEFRTTLGDGKFGNKLILSDKSAFQRVSANTELPLPLSRQSTGEPIAPLGSVKEVQSNSCKLELALSESESSSLSKQTDSGLAFSYDNQHSNRSNWDLNTTMDTWEKSNIDATLKYGQGGKDEDLELGYIHQRSEMDLVEKTHQESTDIHVMSGTCALTESAHSLKLSNTFLKLPSENSGINTDLNLQLNATFGSISLSNLGAPFVPTIPIPHKVSDSSFSVKPVTSSQVPDLAVCNTVKTEPTEEDDGSNKNVGASDFRSVSHTIVKSEAFAALEQGGVKTMCASGVITSASGGAIKSEQLEVPFLEGPRAAEGKAHYHGCPANASGTVNTWEVHHDRDGNASWSEDLAAQGLNVDCNKAHDIPVAPSVVTSQVMGESLMESVPVFITKPLVLNESKLNLIEDMPSNAGQGHDANQNIDNSTNIIPPPVISDINDSQGVQLAPTHVVPQDAKVNDIKASELLSESTAMVGDDLSQVKGASEVGDSTSELPLDSENEGTVPYFIPGVGEQTSYSDGGAQSCGFVSMDACTSHMPVDSKINETDVKAVVKKPESCGVINEPDGSYEVGGVKETVPKHGDDEDFEDGELRESLLRDAMKGSRNAKEKKNVSIKEGGISNVPVRTSSIVFGNENVLQNPDESKDVHCTTESEIRLCPVKDDACLNEMEDAKESYATVTESSKKKAVKFNRKMPQELAKEDSETKATCGQMLGSSPAKGLDNTGDDVGSQQIKAPADQPGPSKTDVSQTCDASKRVSSRSDRSSTTRLRLSSNASSGRINSSRSRSSSQSERERVKDRLVRRENVQMKSSRDESQIHRMHKSEKERDQGQALRKAGSDSMRMRGRNQQSDTLHGVWDPDRGAGRTGKKHVDDELCRPPPRRPSPGGRGPLPGGVQMVRRPMRDISPDDMDNSPLILRTRPNYEPGGNCLIRRERSLSPFQRRAAPHVSHISFASSTRPRARSPHLWSPSRRSPDVFDGHPDLMRCRSPDLRVERVRSPGERACFQENMLGRRHISPHMPQLHGEMNDVSLMRGHDLPKPGRHPQGNLRRFDLIDHRVNSDNFGHLQPGQFRGLEADDVYAEERRNSDEGHGLARPFRQHYIVGDGVNSDGSFHHRVEDISPRPIRLCQDVDGEFPGRGVSRGGGIRNRLGNMHRRLRGVDEQEDNYRHDNGQGWHGDVRLKRRRF